MHDLLKLELSGIRRQSSSGKGKMPVSRINEERRVVGGGKIVRSKSTEKSRERSKSKTKKIAGPSKIFHYTFN
jgi:hypothetical protein